VSTAGYLCRHLAGQIAMSGEPVENTSAVLGLLLMELIICFKRKRSVLCQQSTATLEF